MFPDRKIIAAAIVIVICDHITAGFHQASAMISNARIGLQQQESPLAHAGAAFIGAIFFSTFFTTFFFAIFLYSFNLVGTNFSF